MGCPIVITEMDPRELRRHAAVVQQTAVLFEGTVGDNLMVHAPDATVAQGALQLHRQLRAPTAFGPSGHRPAGILVATQERTATRLDDRPGHQDLATSANAT
jgi:hypothetical protein